MERDTVRVKGLAQERNAMSPAKAQTKTTRGKRTNREAIAPPQASKCSKNKNVGHEPLGE